MVKILALLISLGVGALCGYLFYSHLATSIVATVFISLGFAVATLLVLVILFFAILYLLGAFENKKVIRKTQGKHYRRSLIFMERFLFSLFGMNNHYKGRELLSPNENYIIIANHRSNLDNMVIDVYLKKYPLVFIAKKSLFKVPFVGALIHGCGYLSLDRGNTMQEFETISLAIDMLTREKDPLSVAVFPEGTRNENPDNRNVQPFHPGSFRMAFKSQKPIAIIALRGVKEVNNNLLLKRHPVYLDVVEVIEYDQYKDMDVNSLSQYCHDKLESFLSENCK